MASKVVAMCDEHGVDVSLLANQFSIQRFGCATTLVGTAKPRHLDSAIRAADAPIDEELLADVLALTAALDPPCWTSGRPENN